MIYHADMTIGNRIRAARVKAKLKQREVAKACGVSTQAVSQWEKGEDRPDIDRLPRLWKVLKVPPDWLLDGHGPPPDPDALSQLWDRLNPLARRQALRLLTSLIEDSEEAA